jgi:N-acetylglucosamine malate deacetylase 2
MSSRHVCALLLAALLAGAAQAAIPEADLLAGVAPGPDGMIDVVNIMSHPDDESAYAGGTLAKLKKDPRVRLHVVCLTVGDMSDARWFMQISKEEMARVRTKELNDAARALGADEVIQLSYHDQGLKPADREKLIADVVEIMQRTGAEVVITQDPGGVTHHPDHVTCSAAVTAAFPRGPASRLYYATLPPGRYLYGTLTSPFHEPGKPAKPTLQVDISAELPQKQKALEAHVSQMRHSLVGLVASPYKTDNLEYFALAAQK